MNAHGRAVMADVARLAGVSEQTVSRVVNGRGHVRPDTRAKVREAMRLLDYRPNSLARALATGRTRTLGVVSAGTALHGPASTLFGIERAAHAAGYHVDVAGAVEHLRGVDGILVIANQARGLPDALPIVTVAGRRHAGIPSVAVDDRRGGELAARHLLERGHATVWHIAGPGDWAEARLREAGWRATCPDAPPALRGDWSARSGYELANRLPPAATAVFAANDQMALGVLRRAHEDGRPLSVVGFDDIPEAAYFNPPLTTIRQDFGELGRRAVALLIDELERRARPARHETVAPRLVVRSDGLELDPRGLAEPAPGPGAAPAVEHLVVRASET